MLFQKNYNTYLVTKLLNTSTGEIQIDLNDTPESDTGFLLLEKGIIGKEENIFYHRKSGNSVFCYGVNRSNPVEHLINSTVLLVNSIDAMNYILDNITEQFYIYKESVSELIVTGGEVYEDEVLYTISDTKTSDGIQDKILIVDSVNYIYLTNEGIFITDTNDGTKYIIGEVLVDVLGNITSIKQNKPSALRGIKGEKGDKGNDGLIKSIVGSTYIDVDNTDAANPIINYTGVLTDNNYTTLEKNNLANQSGINTGDQNALGIPYDNTTSGLTATDVKGAIDEMISKYQAVVILKGDWDASTGTFPASTISGWSYIVTVPGTVDGIDFNINDRLFSISDNASTTIYANNWIKGDYTDNVLSVNTKTGIISLDTSDINDTLNKRYVTDDDLIKIGNTTNINSGDQDSNTISVDTTNFNNNLSVSDNTVQKALDTIDELIASGGGGYRSEVYIAGPVEDKTILFEGIVEGTTLSKGLLSFGVAPAGADFIVSVAKSTDDGATYGTAETITVTDGTQDIVATLSGVYAEGNYMKAWVSQNGSTIKGADMNLILKGS